MITTRESINYQFSIIFGYSSPNKDNLIVGDIIGPGNLKKDLVKDLSVDVIKFLTQYNAMLRDYTGSELFFIEFELKNYNPKAVQTKIYPKSMILVPGNYKECESLMLALKPDIGYINYHKSSKAINRISKLFFEVEEYGHRPELSESQEETVFKKFAIRFTKKLYGQLIENKWNKEMIGLSDSVPTEQKFLNNYGKFKSNIDLFWHKIPIELILSDIRFEKVKNPFEGKTAVDHLKFSITEPSACFVIEKTLTLGSNLLNLANTGTIDFFQNIIIQYVIKNIEKDLTQYLEPKSENWLISRINTFLEELNLEIKQYLDLCKEFLISGVKGTLNQILESFKKMISQKGKPGFTELYLLSSSFISQMIIKKQELRANELTSVINYFSELINNTLDIINKCIITYLVNRQLKMITIGLIQNLKDEFYNEKKPVKILGFKIIDDFHQFILRKIETFSYSYNLKHNFEKKIIFEEFKSLIFKDFNEFFEKIKLKPDDIVSFAEINLDQKTVRNINDNIVKFKKFSNEIHFLLSYILRYSTINRYLKDIPDNEISDPVLFSTKFHRFLEKRVAGINLSWKSYILEWIMDYVKIFLKLDNKKEWTLIEIYNDFINYLEERESESQDSGKFKAFLDSYIAKEENEVIKKDLIYFFEQYDYFLGIQTEFPNYIKNKIKHKINNINIPIDNLKPSEYLVLNEKETFYNYIKENELKYFSKLIPIPSKLILKHNLSDEELKLFKGDLFQVFDIKYWGDGFILVNLSDNFKEVYREWIKQL